MSLDSLTKVVRYDEDGKTLEVSQVDAWYVTKENERDGAYTHPEGIVLTAQFEDDTAVDLVLTIEDLISMIGAVVNGIRVHAPRTGPTAS